MKPSEYLALKRRVEMFEVRAHERNKQPETDLSIDFVSLPDLYLIALNYLFKKYKIAVRAIKNPISAEDFDGFCAANEFTDMDLIEFEDKLHSR